MPETLELKYKQYTTICGIRRKLQTSEANIISVLKKRVEGKLLFYKQIFFLNM